MNKIIQLLILCLCMVTANAQIRFESTINTTGSSAASGAIQLEWSMGEQLSIQQFTAGSLVLTTGILQGTIVKITDPSINAEIKLFPNPANDFFNASLQFTRNGKMYLLRAVVATDKNPPVVVTVYRTSKVEKYWRPE